MLLRFAFLPDGTSCLRLMLLIACCLATQRLAAQETPTVQVPAPIVAGQLSNDFSMHSHARSSVQAAAWQDDPRALPVDDAWRHPVAGSMPSEQTPATSVNYPAELTDPRWTDPSYMDAEPFEDSPPESAGPPRRQGFFQKLRVKQSYVAGGQVSDLGITSTEFSVTGALPWPRRDMPLIITPAFGVHFLDGPTAVDLPGQLYDNSLKFQTMFKINERWGANIAVTPGWYSDFQTGSDKAIRISGHAFAAWDQSPQVQWVFGVVYLDWQSISLLPAAGLIYKPNDDTLVELTFPRPRYARRIGCTDRGETWWYLAGEFGGGTWAIQRASGANDVVTISDYRFVLGWEHKVTGGMSANFELGYVFGREIEYESATPDYEPDDSFLLRVGLTY